LEHALQLQARRQRALVVWHDQRVAELHVHPTAEALQQVLHDQLTVVALLSVLHDQQMAAVQQSVLIDQPTEAERPLHDRLTEVALQLHVQQLAELQLHGPEASVNQRLVHHRRQEEQHRLSSVAACLLQTILPFLLLPSAFLLLHHLRHHLHRRLHRLVSASEQRGLVHSCRPFHISSVHSC